MIKRTITYTDYNGVEKTEDFYFDLSRAELLEMELSIDGGMIEMMQKIVNAKKAPEIMKIFKDLLLKSYGEKSADGRSFLKEDENGRPLANKFKQTIPYSILFEELATNDVKAAEFMNGVIPASLAQEAQAAHAAQMAQHPALKK